MSKDDLKDKVDDKGSNNGNGQKSKFSAFMNWIYNPKKKTVLGRTGSSWGKFSIANF